MSADNEGDSQMVSSDSDVETPIQSTILSPPDSQHRAMPTAASGSTFANANGKRPLNTISNGADGLEEIAAAPRPRQEFPPKTHDRSGYRWSRAEDEPGYAWTNKKALDEFHRAWDSLVHKESMVKGRYGDPFEMADKERAMLNSLKQQ